MRTHILTGALALSLLASGAAWAQQDDHHNHGGGDQHGGQGGGGGGGQHHDEGHGGPPGGGGHPNNAPGGGPTHMDRRETGSTGAGAHVERGPAVSEQFRSSQHRGPNGGPSGNAGPSGARQHYSASRFPHTINPGNRYHWHGGWNNQPGYSSRHWGYGSVLPRGWWGRQYYISDYYDYGLGIAPFGYAWVRVGPDALLVNVITGRVVQVAYGLFY